MVKKRILYISASVLLLVLAGFIVVWTNLDWIVKNAIEHYGSQINKTAVRVGKVSLQPSQGKGAIEGLTVANPKGFSSDHIISVGAVRVRLAPKKIASNPLVIDDIRIIAPVIVYEMNDSRISNVDAIRKSLDAGGPAVKQQKAAKIEPKEPAKRLRIKKLVVENATVEVRVAAAGDKPRTLTLKRIELTDIGGEKGATPDRAGKEILSAVLSEVSKEVGKAGASLLLEKGLEHVFKSKER